MKQIFRDVFIYETCKTTNFSGFSKTVRSTMAAAGQGISDFAAYLNCLGCTETTDLRGFTMRMLAARTYSHRTQQPGIAHLNTALYTLLTETKDWGESVIF